MDKVKQHMTDYWSRRVEKFSALRLRELQGDIHLRWLAEFDKYLPMDRKLEILDIGTGTGFFAFLMSACGHHVTGIDITEGMVVEAARLAKERGIDAAFYHMDGEKPDFAPGTFDAIVTRNMTWGLPHLADAYKAWYGLLKPGGILINFDADYTHEKNDEPLPPNHSHKNIGEGLIEKYEDLKDMLRDGQKLRPAWDVTLLQDAGFVDITVDEEVYKRIYPEKDEFYNPTPIFTLVAHKK